MLKIALTGKLRSGKSAVAERLFYEHGFEWPISFGGPLKYYADRIFDVSEGDRKPRAIYQQFGQLCRTIDENVWIKHAEFSVKQALDSRSTRGIVIDDLRQPNEYEWCRENGFVIIRITAPDKIRMARAIEANDDCTVHDFAHETERHTDSFEVDFEVVNDGTIDDLYAQVDVIVAQIHAREATPSAPPSSASKI